MPWTATAAEIKKVHCRAAFDSGQGALTKALPPVHPALGGRAQGYYRMAMTCHPDKHPDDPTAEEKFKRISEAYQVLSNPELKERYDRFGADAAKGGAADIDPKAMFNSMFGGGRFEVRRGARAPRRPAPYGR